MDSTCIEMSLPTLARMIFIGTLSARACCMNVLTVVSPGLKVLFERVGKPEVINRPDFFRLGGTGAVIACNHVGWADSLWLAYHYSCIFVLRWARRASAW